jgi:hypothetical protein
MRPGRQRDHRVDSIAEIIRKVRHNQCIAWVLVHANVESPALICLKRTVDPLTDLERQTRAWLSLERQPRSSAQAYRRPCGLRRATRITYTNLEHPRIWAVVGLESHYQRPIARHDVRDPPLSRHDLERGRRRQIVGLNPDGDRLACDAIDAPWHR